MKDRTLLCRTRTPWGSDASYLTEEGIEVASTQNYEVVRRRVFFDDVHLVTIHRERGIAFLVLTGLFGAFFIGFGILLLAIDTDAWPGALPFLSIGAVTFGAFLLRLAAGREVVTVFGRRSKAVLRFGVIRKQRAREAYGQICAAVRRGQSPLQEAAPVAVAGDMPEMPPMPPAADIPPEPPQA